MERVIFDADLHIDWIQAGLHEQLMLGRQVVRYLSTVVLLELQAGSLTRPVATTVENLYRNYSRMRRLLAPTPETYWRAGSVLRTLTVKHGLDMRGRFRLVNDCLLALSSRQVGATVMTHNERDFRLIQRVAPFALSVVS